MTISGNDQLAFMYIEEFEWIGIFYILKSATDPTLNTSYLGFSYFDWDDDEDKHFQGNFNCEGGMDCDPYIYIFNGIKASYSPADPTATNFYLFGTLNVNDGTNEMYPIATNVHITSGTTITLINEYMWKDPVDSWTYNQSYIALELLDITGESSEALVMLRAAACCNSDSSDTLGIDIIVANSYAKSFYLYEDSGGAAEAYIYQV